jgi:hypothetical protein
MKHRSNYELRIFFTRLSLTYFKAIQRPRKSWKILEEGTMNKRPTELEYRWLQVTGVFPSIRTGNETYCKLLGRF